MRPVDSVQKQEGGRRPAPSRRAARAIAPARSIRLARQVEVREGAVDVGRHHLAGRADIGLVELAVGADAEQREADADLVFEDLEEAHHALGAGRGEAVDIEAAAGDRVGAEDQRLDHVGPSADAAVYDDARTPADRLDDLRQYVDRADALIELPPAMVRHIDAVDPVLDRDLGVLGGRDPFEDQRDVEALFDPLDIAPVELRLKDAGVGDAYAATLMALGDVALAPAVAVGVDGQAKGVIALVDRAADMVVDPLGVAAHIKLEDLEPIAGGF